MQGKISEQTYLKLSKVCSEREGNLPDGNTLDFDNKILIQCKFGHRWRTLPWNVIRGSWCPHPDCLGKRISVNRSAATIGHQYKKIEEIVSLNGGEWIQPDYTNNRTPVNIICKNKHLFLIRPYALFQGGWCPQCIGKKPKEEHLLELHEIAEAHGGKLLSNEYKGAKSRLHWECSAGHRWESTPGSVRTLETWCPHCAGSAQLDIQTLKKEISLLAAKKNGVLLDIIKEKRGDKNRYFATYRCSANHEWTTYANHIKNNIWCPTCNMPGTKEKICRAIFEWITGYQFSKARPGWLINNRSRKMELDGYNKELNLAFEYQGEQHSTFIKFFHDSTDEFNQRRADDERKIKLCKEHGVHLISIDITIPLEELQKFITNEIVRTIPTLKNKLNRNLYDYTTTNTGKDIELEELKIIAKNKNGKCLSGQYINNNTKLEWECGKGHRWFAVPASIKQGHTWCPECKGERISKSKEVDIEPIKKIIQSQGGTLLEVLINNYHRHYRVKCNKNHSWITDSSRLKNGMWCQKCSARKMGMTLKLNLEDLKKLAIARNGRLLSKFYIKSSVRMLWECKDGHKWLANSNSIRRGSWCPVCTGKIRFEFKDSIEKFLMEEKYFYENQ